MSRWTDLRNKVKAIFAPAVAEAKVVITAEEAELIRWAHALLSKITPIIQKLAKDAVIAAATTPGDGATRAAAALTSVVSDLTAQGLPTDINAIKGAIEVEVANMQQVAVTTLEAPAA